jgi:hypothetical protein
VLSSIYHLSSREMEVAEEVAVRHQAEEAAAAEEEEEDQSQIEGAEVEVEAVGVEERRSRSAVELAAEVVVLTGAAICLLLTLAVEYVE